MKLSLAMIVKDEAFYLSVILPRIRDSFDEVVVCDTGSMDDSLPILRRMRATVQRTLWNGYSEARNTVLGMVTSDWVLMMDADEAMFPGDLEALRRIIEREPGLTAIVLPKHEFCGGHETHSPQWYPDLKKRLFKASIGYHYRGNLHEVLSIPAGVQEVERKVPEIHMYHYGQAKPDEVVWLRHENYRRLDAGEPLLKEVPKDQVVPVRTGVPFLGVHPLSGIPRARDMEEYLKGRWV